MNELGLQPNRKHVKCAQIVGEVMGKFHPHGDTRDLRHACAHGAGLLDALSARRRPRELRQHRRLGRGGHALHRGPPRATGHRDAAGHRRRDRRLRPPPTTAPAQEPVVLPSRFPNLLVNGGSGIAVGMATNIPPHNLREVIAATIAYIDDPDIDVEGLMKYIKGPDFPTAGIILGRDGHPRRLRHRPRPRARPGQGAHRADRPGQGGDHRHRAALPGAQGRRRAA